MRWYIEKLSFVGALLLGLVLFSAQSPIANFPPGVFINQAALAPGGAAYQGPLDVVASPTAAWALRAASAASRGTKAVNVCNVSDVVCADLLTDSVTGALVITTVGGSSCSVVVCTIKIWYDQGGGLACSGSIACDEIQATIANRATLLVNCINGKPCAVFSAASSQHYNTVNTASAINQPATFSAVAQRTGAFTSQAGILTYITNAQPQLSYRSVANAVQMYGGTAGQFISNISDSNFHAFQAVFNNTSSVLVCGGSAGSSCSTAGTSNAISPGNSVNTAGAFDLGAASAVNFLTGQVTEVLVYPIAFSVGQQSSMTANQFNYWGPF